MPDLAPVTYPREADTERLWTKAEVARYLGVAVRTVERMAIPRVHLMVTGRRPLVRFRQEQVRAWVDARSTRQGVPAARKAG